MSLYRDVEESDTPMPLDERIRARAIDDAISRAHRLVANITMETPRVSDIPKGWNYAHWIQAHALPLELWIQVYCRLFAMHRASTFSKRERDVRDSMARDEFCKAAIGDAHDRMMASEEF
ncbi:MAG: hypothetical protein MJE77_46690 [Proteobacteria bacterium]|nr:hypothetical protein [Pseudomonadota bacterium]